MNDIVIPLLPDETRDALDAPFNAEEIISAIGSFPKCKSSGPNGNGTSDMLKTLHPDCYIFMKSAYVPISYDLHFKKLMWCY